MAWFPEFSMIAKYIQKYPSMELFRGLHWPSATKYSGSTCSLIRACCNILALHGNINHRCSIFVHIILRVAPLFQPLYYGHACATSIYYEQLKVLAVEASPASCILSSLTMGNKYWGPAWGPRPYLG